MIVFIAGATHTGKTALAQKLLTKYKMPYLSIDHLKMGLIRSGLTSLTPYDDEKLTAHLWPIVREMAKTALENGQNLIIEGCYIPFTWQDDFSAEELSQIKYYCLIMSKAYIENNFSQIIAHESVIEKRKESDCTFDALIRENARNLAACKQHALPYILIDAEYKVEIEL